MQPELALTQAKALVQGIDIPAQPAVLRKIVAEQGEKSPDMGKIAALIGGDVSLTASVIKTVNSPLFGLRTKIVSVPQAVNLLGLSNVVNLVIGLSLRMEVAGKFNVTLERFWDTAGEVALLSAAIARRTRIAPPDEAYCLGLFHDCGIPLLIMKYPAYMDVLKEANQGARKFTEVEDAHLKTNHTVVGFYVAKSWRIPGHICTCILNHHEPDMLTALEAKESNLLAVLKAAEAMGHWRRHMTASPEWLALGGAVLGHLGLTVGDFEEIREVVLAQLDNAK